MKEFTSENYTMYIGLKPACCRGLVASNDVNECDNLHVIKKYEHGD